MNPEKYRKYFSNLMWDVLLAKYLDIVEDEEFKAPAGIGFKDDKFQLVIKPSVFESLEEEQGKIKLLDHEIAHVTSGDIVSLFDKDTDHDTMNIAADAVNNVTYDIEYLAKKDGGRIEGMNYKKMIENGDLPSEIFNPNTIPSKKTLYNYLLKHKPKKPPRPGIDKIIPIDPRDLPKAKEKLKDAITEIIIEGGLRGELSDKDKRLLKKLKENLTPDVSKGGANYGVLFEGIKKTKVHLRLRGSFIGENRKYKRTYRRQRIVGKGILPKYVPLPEIKVVAIIDTSGSVSDDMLGSLLGALMDINKRYNVIFIEFSGNYKIHKRLPVRRTALKSGLKLNDRGNTEPVPPLTEALKMRPSSLIIMSDFEFYGDDDETIRRMLKGFKGDRVLITDKKNKKKLDFYEGAYTQKIIL